jgi:hypothetical protein
MLSKSSFFFVSARISTCNHPAIGLVAALLFGTGSWIESIRLTTAHKEIVPSSPIGCPFLPVGCGLFVVAKILAAHDSTACRLIPARTNSTFIPITSFSATANPTAAKAKTATANITSINVKDGDPLFTASPALPSHFPPSMH